MATRRTQLGRGEETIQLKIRSSVPARLVIEFPKDLGERRIPNVFGKAMILHHPGDVQTFDKDRLVLADDLRREFLNRVSSDVADLGVKPGYFEFGFLSIITALDLAGETALQFLQSLFSPQERARIFKPLSVAGNCKGLDADINPDLGFDLLEWFDISFNQDADEVSLAGVLAGCQVDEFCIIGKRTRPAYLKRIILLGKRNPTVSIRESVRGVANRLRAVFRFEFFVIPHLSFVIARQ